MNTDLAQTHALLNTAMVFLLGAFLPLIGCAVAYARRDARLADELADAREAGRRIGYQQCWREYVQPMAPKAKPLPHNTPEVAQRA